LPNPVGGGALQKGNSTSSNIFPLREGAIYLIKERKPVLSYKLFEKALADGLPGLCVTRQYPERLKEKFNLQNARLIWLSHTPGKDSHNPTNIGTLATLITSFIERYKKSITLLDGIEYLVINNGFQQVLKLTELVNEQVMQSDSIVLMPISESAFSDKELALLERNVETIEKGTQTIDVEKDLTELIDKYRH